MGEYFPSGDGATINGSAEADTIYTFSNVDYETYNYLTIHGNGGGDEIDAGGTLSSTIYGDAGQDIFYGSHSKNTVFYGGNANDELYGDRSFNATFYGEGGNDNFFAGDAWGTVTAYGGDGSDFFTGENSNGNLTFYGDAGSNTFHAGSGTNINANLSAYGGAETDEFHGNDYKGNLTFSGGGGDDYLYADAATKVSIDAGDGNDSVYLSYTRDEYQISFDTSAHTMSFTIDGVQSVETVDVEYFLFNNGDGGWVQYTYEELACFLAGTRIRTPDGEVPVETLKAGDLVLTTTGEAKPVLWLGRRAVATAFAHPLTALPIHIRPDALGRGLPERDLFVSPDHAFFIGGMLVQAGALVNGVTITRHRDLPETFTYYHVELEDHDLIFAEGLPAETFIDNQERETFDNAAEFPGRARPAVELDLPRVKSRRQLPKVLARALEERALRAAPRGAQAA